MWPNKSTQSRKPFVPNIPATIDLLADPEGRREAHASAGHPVKPLPEDEKADHLEKRVKETGDRQEALLDEALEETFPGSDPISPKHIT